MNYPSEEKIIKALKNWNGWDNEMIEMIKTVRGLKLLYRIMQAEKK